METVITHLQENPIAYAVIGACLLPILYLTRKIVAPIFFYSVEVVLYSAIFHLVFAGAVRFLTWFRQASKFRYWETEVNDTRLYTPIANFWMRDQYSPEILFWIECVAFAIIVFIVIYFRPMNLGAKNTYSGNRKKYGEASAGDFTKRRRGRMAYAGGRPGGRRR